MWKYFYVSFVKTVVPFLSPVKKVKVTVAVT